MADPGTITAELAFARAEEVSEDEGGLLRARTIAVAAEQEAGAFDRRRCSIADVSRGTLRPALWTHGFDVADLGGRGGLQAALERVRRAGRLDEGEAAAIRGALRFASLRLASGGRLRILHIAREGFFMRRALPGGAARSLGPGEHDAAIAVHVDQDVDGTPLRQLLGGLAPRLFRHDAPLHHNHRGRLVLVNLWIGLDQVTRPLALMDGRSLDRRAHQVRYGLPLPGIIDGRRPGMEVNDIWKVLHDRGQRWYFDSEMDGRRAWVFDTLSTPHGSFVIGGEGRAAARREAVVAAAAAIERGALAEARAALEREVDGAIAGEAAATGSLAGAIATVERLIAEGQGILAAGAATAAGEWARRASEAAERLVRKSIEMRAVALLGRPAEGE